MPVRRRRKSIGQRRRLHFTESPINVMRNVPSPVYANDNPPHADVVPVDSSITWVSPQFQKMSGTVKKRRRRKPASISGGLNKSKLITRSRHRSEKENGVLRPGFVPLRFMGDKSISPCNVSEQESFTESQLTGVQFNNELVSTGEQRVKQPKPQRPQQNLSLISSGRLASFPLEKQRAKCVKTVHESEDGLYDTKGKEPSSVSFTQHRPKVQNGRKPIKRLFAEQCNSSKEASGNSADLPSPCGHSCHANSTVVQLPSDTTILHGDQEAPFCPKTPENCPDADSEDSAESLHLLLSVQSSQGFELQVPSHTGTPQRTATSGSCEELGSTLTVTPQGVQRRSARLKLLFTTPVTPKQKSAPGKILAVDTPEDEYGLTVREKVILRLRKQGRWPYKV